MPACDVREVKEETTNPNDHELNENLTYKNKVGIVILCYCAVIYYTRKI